MTIQLVVRLDYGLSLSVVPRQVLKLFLLSLPIPIIQWRESTGILPRDAAFDHPW